MEQFNVYARYDVSLERGSGVYVFDSEGTQYLDLYGGHGVISIGHSHPTYVQRISEQLHKIGFYSNSVDIPIQDQLAQRLGEISGYASYSLFLCNSGAEANENALKLASFHTGRRKVIAFNNSFHGRTGAALNITFNKKISAPLNMDNFPVEFIDLNDRAALISALASDDVCAVIVEGIQGVGGLDMPDDDFLRFALEACHAHGTMLILDEIQSGYGRSGKFFAHQHAGIMPDLVTTAKGMGNGFPVAGVLISPEFHAKSGMLGTTFGGNQLACAAALAVLDTVNAESLTENAAAVGAQLAEALGNIHGIVRVKGRGLMLGAELNNPVNALRKKLLTDHKIFTGSSDNPHVIRILPPLNISYAQAKPFIDALTAELQ